MRKGKQKPILSDIEEMENEAEEVPVSKRERSRLAMVSMVFLEIVKLAILAGLTVGVVRYFLFKPFTVKGQSMEPNFYERDYLIIDELSYRFRGPQRGEVVVFQAPVAKDYYLKRVVGLPGERVKIEDDKVIIYNEEHPQGVVVDEVYTDEETNGSITLNLGLTQYFVLGDNRNESYDSRRFGPIDKSAIIGRAWVRGWPFTRAEVFEAPEYNF